MATSIEIKYFNSFWLKTVNTALAVATWPNGYPYNNATKPLPVLGGGTLAPFPGTGNSGGSDTTSTGESINWFIEESRIRGGYNNTQVDLGVRAFLVEDGNLQQRRKSSLIYSGIYNSRTGINNTNQFSVAEDITKTLDPVNGSIQKLFAENTNMTIFQESKVSSVLVDKDAIYTAEGSPIQTTSNVVLGQVQPYLGEYGISTNPESFAVYGFQKYFTDKDRGVVLRLSRDGITEISNYGMIDYFRDNLSALNDLSLWTVTTGPATESDPHDNTLINVNGADLNTVLLGMSVIVDGEFSGNIVEITPSQIGGVVKVDRPIVVVAGQSVLFQTTAPSKALGSYDIHNKNYVLSLQAMPQYAGSTLVTPTDYSTLTFDELINGWSSFYSYKPTQMFSIRNDFYSIEYANIWKHYSTAVNSTSFYGTTSGANITFVFNQNPSINKVFQTVNYEGDSGWQVDSFITDATGYDFTSSGWEQFNDSSQPVLSYIAGTYVENGITYHSGFNRKENRYYANLVNVSTAQPGEVVFGQQVSGLKGRFATVKFATDNATDQGGTKELWAVGTKVNYIRQ
jgi:hypothetical protein